MTDRPLDRRRANLSGDLEAAAEVPLPSPGKRSVDREEERLVAGLGRLLDHGAGDPAIAEEVDLHPALPARCRLGDLCRAGAGQAGQAHHGPRVGRGARHPGLAVGVGEELEGDRRHQEGKLQLGAEDGRHGRDVRDVDQDARPQFPALVGLGISPQGALVARAAGEVAVHARLELLCRQPL